MSPCRLATITDMYNVLEKLGRGEPLTAGGRAVGGGRRRVQVVVELTQHRHQALLVHLLDLDLPDERKLPPPGCPQPPSAPTEERRGIVHTSARLPEPPGAAAQGALELPAAAAPAGKAKTRKAAAIAAWPKHLADQLR